MKFSYPIHLARLVFGWCAMFSLAAAAESIVIESRPAPVRDHVLYVGTELNVRVGKDLLPVRRIEDRTVRLESGERLKLRRSGGLQLRPLTKVSANDVKVEGLDVQRCYSPAADPTREQMRTQVEIQEYAASQASAAEVRLRRDVTPDDPNTTPSPDGPSAEQQAIDSANLFSAFSDAQGFESGIWSQAASSGRGPGPSRGLPDFDAVRLKFEVSSPSPMQDVQGVVVVRMIKDGELSDLSFTTAIGEVGPRPRNIDMVRSGIPPGYEIKTTRLHLFVGAEELPTNLSEKRYAVTTEEAFEYLRLAYMSEHRGEDVPAEPAWSMVPSVLLQRNDGRDLDFPVTVDIDDKGRLLRLHDEEAVIPVKVRDLVAQMYFVPALRDGEAVASTLTFNPASFFQ